MIPPRYAGPVAAPHAASAGNVPRVMLWVSAALLPASLFGFWLYRWPAVHLWWITTGSAILGDAFRLPLMQKPLAPVPPGLVAPVHRLVAGAVTRAPWWAGVAGGLFATIIGKDVFGGIRGQHTKLLVPTPKYGERAPGGN